MPRAPRRVHPVLTPNGVQGAQMSHHNLILVGLLLMASAFLARRLRAPAPTSTVSKARASAAARAVVRARIAQQQSAPRPSLPRVDNPEAFEWAAPKASNCEAVQPEDLRARLRDRYIAARFPGMARGASALHEIEHVIHTARLFFEDGKVDRAHELLALAVQESPRDKSLRLAQLEIAFLCADADAYTPLAFAFDAAFPGSPEWADVSRLGRALAPSQPRFEASSGAGASAHAHAHYGPWPDTPNWIQASWDLTSDVLAADFHRAIAQRADTGAQPLRRVA
jgi:hypothetical protein